ncbi:40S ribosomal protein S15a-1-like isoform X2 [Triticum urartu]|uniref:40S ribosomal protein S15a-1-like isoform X2 n=1 Tax=Triticum urartu TaxID=4572 RepID=UPI002042E7E4|nr:40S ribosomal protein S15a-1-like isoform X2 [Triticum urartu]
MHVPSIDPLILWIDRPFLWCTVFQDVHVVLCRLSTLCSKLVDALKSMYSTEKRGKREVMSRPQWKDTLVGESEYVDDHRSSMTDVKLNGRLNKCSVISPRLDLGDRVLECKAAPLTSDHGT